MLTKGKLNIIIDGQFGSTGKGLLAGYLAEKYPTDFSFTVASCGPNAGHTYINKKGEKLVTHHLPMAGAAGENKSMYICAGSVVRRSTLLEEVKLFSRPGSEVFLSEDVADVLDCHIGAEAKINSDQMKIASTMKGTGQALADKILRKHNLIHSRIKPRLSAQIDYHGLLEPVKLMPSRDMGTRLMDLMDSGETGIMEISQGVDLSINGGFFPYCTSREISVSQALSDAGIHPKYLGKVFMSVRTHPIRVGNVNGNSSGPFYPDSEETTWETIGVTPEYTTVTGRMRRVATWSNKQFANSVKLCRPDVVFLNFINYINEAEKWDLVKTISEIGGSPQILGGFGPAYQNVRSI